MHVPLDLVTSEIGMSHRAAADQAAVRSVARLVNREERMRRRMARVTGRLAGRNARWHPRRPAVRDAGSVVAAGRRAVR